MPTRPSAASQAEITTALAALPGWSADAGWLRRVYKTDGWPTTLMLVNAIGFAAEAADHHPDLKVSWGSVEVGLQTHTAGGITAKDLELARVIERTATWRPEPGGALDGTSRKWVQ
jgi:4a-hydroxytetrahydrobiopterin dehydratase